MASGLDLRADDKGAEHVRGGFQLVVVGDILSRLYPDQTEGRYFA
jgi:hypothetical protein